MENTPNTVAELYASLKTLFGLESKPVVKIKTFELKYEVAKTTDGKTVGTETDAPLAMGDMLLMVQADGTVVAATEGDYTLEDGRVISCDATGMITNIVPAPAPAADPAVEQSAPNSLPKQTVTTTSTVVEEKAIFENQDIVKILIQKIDEMENAINAMKENNEKANVEFAAQFKALSDQPSGKPVNRVNEQPKPVDTSKMSKMERDIIRISQVNTGLQASNA